ncbi:hypothetical protein [Halomarina oriensis]|uniref:Uncharacterized protein n=1 Tax=Halomarina oriensis TaxID=671145 RepID=A0A6B0GIH7_9EURY|nr:hypothetical protein [Halomarina oriensis]MWG33259.1 hypothetical protein [Halomarina oriensis]
MKRRSLLALLGISMTAGCSDLTRGLTGNGEREHKVRATYSCDESADPSCTATIRVEQMGRANQYTARLANTSSTSTDHILDEAGDDVTFRLNPDQTVEVYAEYDDSTRRMMRVP